MNTEKRLYDALAELVKATSSRNIEGNVNTPTYQRFEKALSHASALLKTITPCCMQYRDTDSELHASDCEVYNQSKKI